MSVSLQHFQHQVDLILKWALMGVKDISQSCQYLHAGTMTLTQDDELVLNHSMAAILGVQQLTAQELGFV